MIYFLFIDRCRRYNLRGVRRYSMGGWDSDKLLV